MTFGELYGEALNHELGSGDTSELFTTVRRKAAVNRAQREFARLTQCFIYELTQPITHGQGAYDLDLLSGDTFVNFHSRPLRLQRTTTAGGAITETRLERHDPAWMDRERDGWRNRPSAGTPDVWAFVVATGNNFVVLDPVPAVPATETWAVMVPAVLNPTDMSGDGEMPFSKDGNGQSALEPFHWALAHYAAGLLERLRKDQQAIQAQLAMFGAYVQDYKATRRPRGGDVRVTQARDYLRRARTSGSGAIEQGDPRV